MARLCKYCSQPTVGDSKMYCSERCMKRFHQDKWAKQPHAQENDIWRHMRYRCNNPHSKDYPRYGARGIRVCERWESFDNFLADMGPKPPGFAIERKDNSGNYEPGNCIWAPPSVQNQNKSNVWTAAELAILRNGIDNGLSDEEIARVVGKTVGGVDSRARRMGLRGRKKSASEQRLSLTISSQGPQ